MAKKFGFFNSINGDRKYLASDISQAFDIGVTTGIKAEENNLKVVAYEGMQVQIQPGSAMIFGHFFMNDEPEIIDIDTADAELNRIDRVVVRYDAYTREVNTAVIKGSPALSPTPPARLETGEQFDLVLADIYVPAAATVINTSNITDMRDSELCGYIGVKGAVTKFEFESHLADYAELLAGGTPYELTLINGWTGTLKVKINKLNQLHIWGMITPGVTDPGTEVAERIPAQYRVPVDEIPTIAIPAHTVNGGIMGLAYFGGRLRIYNPAASEVGTNQIRISYIIQGV